MWLCEVNCISSAAPTRFSASTRQLIAEEIRNIPRMAQLQDSDMVYDRDDSNAYAEAVARFGPTLPRFESRFECGNLQRAYRV